MPTDMTKVFRISCLRICNVDDVKVIEWIWIWSRLFFQQNQLNTTLRRKINKNIA